jgi:hypothetical protein
MVPISASEQTSSHLFLPGLVCILFVLSLPAQVGGLSLRFLGLFREALPRFIIEQLPVSPCDDYTSLSSSPVLHMMGVLNEKATMAVGQTDSPKPSALNAPDVNNVGDSDSTHPEKPVHGMPDDKYPHGLNLVLLAGASIAAVFLIALDQVSTPPTYANTVKNTSDTKGV